MGIKQKEEHGTGGLHNALAAGTIIKGNIITETDFRLDGTVEGMECAADRVFSVQYHPESAPGPEDSGYLFEKFVAYMKEGGKNA